VKLSVVIPVWRDLRVRECLDSLYRSQGVPLEEFEVLVVDNGPSDEIRRIVQDSPARYLIEPRRGSYTARNTGVEQARGAVLVFTDADCVPPPGWLREIWTLFETGLCRLAVGPSYGLDASCVAEWVQSIDDERWAALSHCGAVVYCDTRNFAARREVFDLERFDAEFLCAGDLEFGLRLSRHGETIQFVPRMRLGHQNPVSLWAVLLRAIRRGRGIEALHRKHGPDARISASRPLRLMGRDVKPQLMRLLRRAPLRWIGIGALGVLQAVLYVLLLSLARLPRGRKLGLRPFRVLERASILMGRLLGASGGRRPR
jgi:glycosyltransferase involved in cell wall biosynthesis